MPLNLDSCIAGVFTPGNIGASSGLTPVEPVFISRPGDVMFEAAAATAVSRAGISRTGAIVETATASSIVSVGVVLSSTMIEAATATDAPSLAAIVADVVETAAANSAQSVAVAVRVALAGPWPVMVNSGTSRQANVNGVMVNL
jgi:hypothetical protein